AIFDNSLLIVKQWDGFYLVLLQGHPLRNLKYNEPRVQPKPPRSVDNVYNHICDSAAPPIKTAGPKLRAGFNDTSVIVPPITIRATKIKPIISPAKCESPF